MVFAIVGFAFAQEVQRTFTLINPTISHLISPGENAEGTTKIINESNSTLTFTVAVQDFIVTDDLGTPNLLPPNTLSNKYSAASWIGVTPSTFTVAPGHSQVINYYVQIPPSAKPGGHYAALVFEPSTSNKTDTTGGSVHTQIGSLFYLTVKGPVKESASVSKFFTDTLQEYGPVKILTQIKNNSDVHITPKGNITVSGLFLNQTKELQSYNVFPEADRIFENTFGNGFMFGPYKASLTASYGQNGNLPLVASLTFWVIPWRLIIIIILIIVVVVLGIKYWRKRNQNPPTHKNDSPKMEESEMTAEK